MRKSAALILLGTVAVLALWKVVPYMSAQAPVVDSTPTPPPLNYVATLKLAPGSRICTDNIVYTRESRYAQLINLGARRVPKLAVTASAPGYLSRSAASPTAEGSFDVPLRAPVGEEPQGTLCVRNNGSSAITLAGLPPLQKRKSRTLYPTRSRTSIDGRPVPNSLSVTLLRERSASRWTNIPASISKAATLRPAFPALIWVLALLLAIGAPVALAVAIGFAAGGDPKRPPLTASGRAPDPAPSKPEER